MSQDKENQAGIILYFSGTGNTKFVALRFSQLTKAPAYSIEEKVDFATLITESSRITLVYPIHHSTAPVLFKRFIMQHSQLFIKKEIIILCTQQFFSGDGAFNITKYLPKDIKVLYADHIAMPANIGNIPVYSVLTKGNFTKRCRIATTRLKKAIRKIDQGVRYTRGFSGFAHWLGRSQNKHESEYLHGEKESIQVASSCILCKKCIHSCPTQNLEVGSQEKIEGKGQCTFCWRCVNICPKKAITVGIHLEPKFQYYVIPEVDAQFSQEL